MTNAWPWLGSGRESGEPFCHGVISECRCMWKTAGSKSRGVALKSAASTSPGKGAVVRQADGRPSSTADLIANPPVLRSSVDVTVDVGWNGTCRRCPGIATASFSAPDGFACVLRCFSRAGGTDSSSLDTAWKCISAMHRLGGAKALPDDLRQTHRDRPLSQPLSHPPGSTLAPGSLSLTWVLAADAGTRCWGPRRKNTRVETLQVSTLSGLLLKSCRGPELLRQPSGCVVGTGIVMWTPVAGGEKKNELTQSPGGKRWIPQLITSK